MTIHKEGFPTIFLSLAFVSLILLVTFFYFGNNLPVKIFSVIICAGLMVIVLQFFRNPFRRIQLDENKVLAPADGKVVVIEEVVETEFFREKRIQVSIFMSPFNVHVNRNPVGGVVRFVKYHPGKYLVAWHPKSSTENERTTIVVETKHKQQVLFRQIAGALARRIVNYLKEGETVVQGNEMGFIKFGSRVDIFLPLAAKVCVQLNQAVAGGKTVIAEIQG